MLGCQRGLQPPRTIILKWGCGRLSTQCHFSLGYVREINALPFAFALVSLSCMLRPATLSSFRVFMFSQTETKDDDWQRSSLANLKRAVRKVVGNQFCLRATILYSHQSSYLLNSIATCTNRNPCTQCKIFPSNEDLSFETLLDWQCCGLIACAC